MGGLSSINIVYISLIFLVPGFVIRAIRSQFVIEQDRTGADQIIRLLTYSSLNNAFFGSLAYTILNPKTLEENQFLLWSFLILIAPLITGVTSSIVSKKEWVYKAFKSYGARPIHIVPNAWDYVFSVTDTAWVLVTLKNDVVFRGFWGGKSFASSDPKERDILIEAVFGDDGSHPWKPLGTSVLISSSEIRTVEFFPYNSATIDPAIDKDVK